MLDFEFLAFSGCIGMNWQDRIVSDPDTLFSKLRIRGTRIEDEFILGLFVYGWDEVRMLESYPYLIPADL